MSRKNKLQRFADLGLFPNVYENFDMKQPELTGQNGVVVDMKGQWCEKHFKNKLPLTLELACGRGEYSLGLARESSDKNFIGVDIKGARIWQGATKATNEKLDNVAFVRTRIEQINLFFGSEEVSEIWITFPDPFLRESKANRRLTSDYFINQYRQILKKDGIVHLKTDEPNLYEFTLNTLNADPQCNILYQDDDIYSKPLPYPELEIKTYYEHMHLKAEKTIKYIRFTI